MLSWLAVMDGFSPTSTYCGITSSGNVLALVMLQAPEGWFYHFVVVY